MHAYVQSCTRHACDPAHQQDHPHHSTSSYPPNIWPTQKRAAKGPFFLCTPSTFFSTGPSCPLGAPEKMHLLGGCALMLGQASRKRRPMGVGSSASCLFARSLAIGGTAGCSQQAAARSSVGSERLLQAAAATRNAPRPPTAPLPPGGQHLRTRGQGAQASRSSHPTPRIWLRDQRKKDTGSPQQARSTAGSGTLARAWSRRHLEVDLVVPRGQLEQRPILPDPELALLRLLGQAYPVYGSRHRCVCVCVRICVCMCSRVFAGGVCGLRVGKCVCVSVPGSAVGVRV